MVYVLIGLGVVILLVICFCLSVASFSFDNFKSSQEKADTHQVDQGMTVEDFVKRVNHDYLHKKLDIEICDKYHDHFSAGVIALSESTLESASLSSFSIVAHEMGHAVQYEKGELTKHWQAKKKRRILGKFFIPLIALGIVFLFLSVLNFYPYFTMICGIVCFGIALFIFFVAIYAKYKEIQVEKGASDYGLQMLEEYMTDKEMKICREFLDAARLTYWGSLFRTMFGWLGISQKDTMFG